MGEPWVIASCHIMAHTTDWVVYLVCRSFSQTSENLCMGPGRPKLTYAPGMRGGEKGARCMHGLNEPFPATGADNVLR